MNGPLDWGRWASKMALLWRLNDGAARVLGIISDHVNREGVSTVDYLTAAKLGELAAANGRPRSERTVRYILRGLRAQGLVSIRQRGPNKAPEYTLHDILPVDQLALDLAGESEVGKPGSPATQVAALQPGSPATAVAAKPGNLGCRQEREERDVVVVATRAARDQPHALHPQLAEVLDILRGLPEPYRQVEPLAVDHALQAYPRADAVSAANVVATKVHSGQTRTFDVHNLLLGVLRRTGEQLGASSTAAGDSPGGPGSPAASSPKTFKRQKPWTGALREAREEAERARAES